MPNNQIKNISIPVGKFYGPCSGHDVTFAIENFASEVHTFVFCDVNYRQNTMKSFKYLPKCYLDWELISRKFKQDKSNLIKKIPNSNKSFHTFCTIDNWQLAPTRWNNCCCGILVRFGRGYIGISIWH